ncbi:MAG: hypothetical protein VX381_02560 [Candidatus Thermoplasmatota archaeon]|jgi:hypothetical protein|nr:hypothetical protein [Candidatus Thermoplasmatota archaeon]|tara:strand:- start:202 stop:549 length:348 start_codon:yes stop_codon:yes gene_type:complete
MARVDSLLWFMLGIGQLLIGSQLGSSGALLELLSILLNVSGGSSLMLGIYFLIFLARHEKEFSEVYSKMEKTEFVRDETGRIIDVADKTPKAIRAVWYAIPALMTFLGALAWLIG